MKMERILVAYDNSEESKKALDKAISILDDGEIFLIWVIPEERFVTPDVEREAEKNLSEIVDNLKKKGFKCKGIIGKGDVANEIIKEGNELDCDLIVLGCGGKGHVMGSVADKVVHHSHKAVMVVR